MRSAPAKCGTILRIVGVQRGCSERIDVDPLPPRNAAAQRVVLPSWDGATLSPLLTIQRIVPHSGGDHVLWQKLQVRKTGMRLDSLGSGPLGRDAQLTSEAYLLRRTTAGVGALRTQFRFAQTPSALAEGETGWQLPKATQNYRPPRVCSRVNQANTYQAERRER